jgi:hypothetical protein
MKTFLRYTLSIAFFITVLQQAHSQCVVSNIVIQNVTVAGTQVPGSCTVTFDASFTIENNNGNKYIFIHAWILSEYPNYFNCVNGAPSQPGAIRAPEYDDLEDAFINVGINNSEVTPLIIMDYPPDANVDMTTVQSITKELTADGSAIFILKGITATVPVTCGTPVVLVADVWSSQSAQAQNAHCVNCGILYSAGIISLSGLANCASMTYTATVTNNTNQAISGFYRVYVDVNGDGYLTPAMDTLIQDTTAFSLSASMGSTTTLTGPIPSANINQDLFIVITQTSGQASGASRVTLVPSTQCAPLPVSFRSFTARRINRTFVDLRWETATEINNVGFAIQRNTGNNQWQVVGYVPTHAPAGNSSSVLTYSFTDANNHKGVSQYRIRQVDLDGKTRFSEVRAVRADGQKGETLIYPVPSLDGKVTIVFDDRETMRDLTLTDMLGRTVRQWRSVTGNVFQLDQLRPGIYTIGIYDRNLQELTMKKILVTVSK